MQTNSRRNLVTVLLVLATVAVLVGLAVAMRGESGGVLSGLMDAVHGRGGGH